MPPMGADTSRIADTSYNREVSRDDNGHLFDVLAFWAVLTLAATLWLVAVVAALRGMVA